MGYDVYYTRNNFINTRNKGIKELQDIFDCIDKYDIRDDDFIIKLTGRYILDTDSEFMEHVKDLHSSNKDCILKFGGFYDPKDYQMEDCITGVIGMRCRFVKQIALPTYEENVEWKWAAATYLIDDDKIQKVNKLGISICPGCNTYFKI